MIFDLLREKPDVAERADVCVVGAGAAGILLAVELRRLGKTVLLLEGGGPEVEEAAQEPYRSEVRGLAHRGVHEGRFRAKGGTTTRWGGQILELNEEDFERREWIAGSGWPIAKADLTRFYERALELEGIGGVERSDAAVWARLGLTEPEFAEMDSYLSRWLPEPNLAVVHGEQLEKDDGLRVWLHANCVEMVMEQESVRAIRCRTQDGREAMFAADEFVVCMGTIECCRFFLQPREGGLPWNASGLLGKHFQDHVDSNAAELKPLNRAAFGEMFDNIFVGGYKYHPKLRLDAAEQARAEILNCAATMYFLSDADEALGAVKTTAKHLLRGRLRQVGAGDVAGMFRNAPQLAMQAWLYGVKRRAYNPANATVKLRVHCEQRPDAESRITLSEERDSIGLLRTRLEWRISSLEIRTIRHFAETAALSLAGMAEVIVDAELMEGDGMGYVARCDDSNHHMGGMRMSATAAGGIVDTDLRLHGTRNCYACSGAVMPTSGFSNPTHTVLALAMRLAEHLAGTR
jgi:choline dehydrogenase-like flavoprotein